MVDFLTTNKYYKAYADARDTVNWCRQEAEDAMREYREALMTSGSVRFLPDHHPATQRIAAAGDKYRAAKEAEYAAWDEWCEFLDGNCE